jgi:hypothetical protein
MIMKGKVEMAQTKAAFQVFQEEQEVGGDSAQVDSHFLVFMAFGGVLPILVLMVSRGELYITSLHLLPLYPTMVQAKAVSLSVASGINLFDFAIAVGMCILWRG